VAYIPHWYKKTQRDMGKLSLIEYEGPDGKCPFKLWADSIRNIQTQARIIYTSEAKAP